jgi:hypothetical protein
VLARAFEQLRAPRGIGCEGLQRSEDLLDLLELALPAGNRRSEATDVQVSSRARHDFTDTGGRGRIVHPRIQFAMQQNDVPVVKAARVENYTEETLRDLELHLSTEPAFAEPLSARISSVAPGAAYNLDAVDLQLSPSFLGELTERVRGQLRAELRRNGGVLASRTLPVELLARDEWGGLASLPEILAATSRSWPRVRRTGTLWDLTGTAAAGPLAGSRLNQVATYSAMWFAWASFNQDTELFLP